MSKALYKAAALEARLAELAGPEWASDDEANAAAGAGKKAAKDFVAVDGAAKQKQQKGKDRKAAKGGAPSASSGVVYLGHIPHGFYEDQMRGFFSQFGDIVRLRLSRSKKTAKSRGYAFIEFETKEVAAIAADTMNGYYLEGRKLVCHVMDPKDIHERMFDGANRQFQKISWRKLERERVNKPKTEEAAKKCTGRLLSKESKKRKRLAELGIEYDFPGLARAIKEARDEEGEDGEEQQQVVEPPKKKAAVAAKKPAEKKAAPAAPAPAAAKPAEAEKEGKAGKAKKRPRQEEESKAEETEKPSQVVKKAAEKAAVPAEPVAKKQAAAAKPNKPNKPGVVGKEKPAPKAKQTPAASAEKPRGRAVKQAAAVSKPKSGGGKAKAK